MSAHDNILNIMYNRNCHVLSVNGRTNVNLFSLYHTYGAHRSRFSKIT